MSLILEALKKSEAERRLGRAPGLMTPALEPVREHHRVGLVLAMVAIAVVVAAATWWLVRRDAQAVVQAPAEPVQIVERVPAPAPAASPVVKLPEPAPQPVRNPPPESRREAAPPRVDPTFAANAQERESRAMPASNSEPPPMPSAPAQVPERAPPLRTQTPSAEPASAPVAEAPAEPFVPNLRHLSTSEREALPPLRLSMHVFNTTPAGRFVIIDGQRYTEGQSIAQGLMVAEIRRDGVVIERSGQRFLLSRP